MCRKVEQVSDERPSRRARWERRAPRPDETTNKVQCQPNESDIKDVGPHDSRQMELRQGEATQDECRGHGVRSWSLNRLYTRNVQTAVSVSTKDRSDADHHLRHHVRRTICSANIAKYGTKLLRQKI